MPQTDDLLYKGDMVMIHGLITLLRLCRQLTSATEQSYHHVQWLVLMFFTYAIESVHPARVIKTRFTKEIILPPEKLLWRDWPVGKMTRNLTAITSAKVEALPDEQMSAFSFCMVRDEGPPPGSGRMLS